MPEPGRSGVSPLVATILLIVFSFALGAVVLSWGESFVEERAEFVNNPNEVKPGCVAIDFAILDIEGKSAVCSRSNGIEVVLDNSGPELVAIQAKLITRDSIQVLENVLATPLAQGETRRVIIPYTGAPLQQLRLVPSILDGTVALCPASAKVINNPPEPCV